MQGQGCHLSLTWRAHFEVLLCCQDRIKEVGAPASPGGQGRPRRRAFVLCSCCCHAGKCCDLGLRIIKENQTSLH